MHIEKKKGGQKDPGDDKQQGHGRKGKSPKMTEAMGKEER
jgi:hypothetical protein